MNLLILKNARVVGLVGVLGTLPSAMLATAQPLDLTEVGLVAPDFRGDANTTYFGWDSFDFASPAGPFGNSFLSDATPDIGSATGALIQQDDVNDYGHRSGSGNYYSGFGPFDFADDTITVVTDGVVGDAGYTTVIVQALSQAGIANGSVVFEDVGDVSPTVYYGLEPSDAGGSTPGGAPGEVQVGGDTGHYFVVYEFEGNAESYDLGFSSTLSSIAFDTFVIDTVYSDTPGAFDQTVLVPEPASLVLLALGGLALTSRRRRAS